MIGRDGLVLSSMFGARWFPITGIGPFAAGGIGSDPGVEKVSRGRGVSSPWLFAFGADSGTEIFELLTLP